jgi:hypothetical protein
VTEDELRQHACQMAGLRPAGVQPPFAEVAVPLHPDSPVDYEDTRSEIFGAVLGPADTLFHAPLGVPHIDVERHPPNHTRPFWCYTTNGMSDFPQSLPDGTTFRSEIMCCSGSEAAIWPELLRVLGTFPFRCSTFLHPYHTVPFPDGVGEPRFTYVMTTPPFLVSNLAKARFLGEPLLVMSTIRITEAERQLAVEESSRTLVERLPDELDTWLIDGRAT